MMDGWRQTPLDEYMDKSEWSESPRGSTNQPSRWWMRISNPFLCRDAHHTHPYKGQLHFKPSTEASSHTPLTTQEHRRQEYWLLKHSKKPSLAETSVDLLYQCVCFSWLSSCASDQTCSTKDNADKTPAAVLHSHTVLPLWCRGEVNKVRSARHLLYHCSGCSSPFIFKVKES